MHSWRMLTIVKKIKFYKKKGRKIRPFLCKRFKLYPTRKETKLNAAIIHIAGEVSVFPIKSFTAA